MPCKNPLCQDPACDGTGTVTIDEQRALGFVNRLLKDFPVTDSDALWGLIAAGVLVCRARSTLGLDGYQRVAADIWGDENLSFRPGNVPDA